MTRLGRVIALVVVVVWFVVTVAIAGSWLRGW
jgi:hypothetical protein